MTKEKPSNLFAFKQQCTRLFNESEDNDECNAYREIVTHMEEHQRLDTDGLSVDLAYKTQEYDQRADQIRRVQPLSMLVTTLETKARIYRKARQILGGSLI